MGKLGEQRKEARVNRIHGAAMKLFAEQGYEATTMEQIAERADFSVRSLYNYFASKADIFVDTLTELQNRIHGIVFNEIERLKGPAPDRFARVVRTIYEMLDDERSLICELVSALLSPHTRLSDQIRPMEERYRDVTRALLSKCIEDGELPEAMDVEHTTDLMMIVAAGLDMHYLKGEIENLDALETRTKQVVGALLRGLTAELESKPQAPRLPGVN